MSVLHTEAFAVTDGATATYASPGRSARGLTILNESGCYVLLRIGATDPPASMAAATRTLNPRTLNTLPIGQGDIGLRFVGSITDQPAPALPAGGRCIVTWDTTPHPERSDSLPGASISSPGPVDSYPYTALGNDKTGVGSFASIDATGKQALRLYGRWEPSTDPETLQLLLTMTLGVGAGANTFLFLITLLNSNPNGGGFYWQLPLPYLASPNTLSIVPSVIQGTASVLHLTPVLLIGSQYGFEKSF